MTNHLKLIVLMFLLFVCAHNFTYAQNYGNTFYLKYGVTANDFNKDVTLNGINLSHSLSKPFLLKNVASPKFLIPTYFNPSLSIGTTTLGESQGERIQISYPGLNTGLTVGLNRYNPTSNQAFIGWNKTLEKNGLLQYVNISANILAQNLDNIFKRNNESIHAQSKGVNGNLVIQNVTNNKRNTFVSRTHLITNHSSNHWMGRSDTTPFLTAQRGALLLSELTIKRRMSTNHFLSLSGQIEKYQSKDSLFEIHNTQSFNRLNLVVKDEIRFKKARIVNEIRFADNQTDLIHFETADKQEHQVLLWVSNFLRKDPTKKYGFSYHHQLGVHSEDGLIFNPAFKFFQHLKTIYYDFGVRQSSRTPALYSEFQLSPLPAIGQILGTSSQELYRKAFVSLKTENNYQQSSMLFKYIYNQSPNRWLFSFPLNQLEQMEIAYSELYFKYSRPQHLKHHFDLVYKYTLGETNSASVIADHWIHGSYSYRLHNRAINFKKKQREYDLLARADVGYMSGYDLQYLDGNARAKAEENLFVDVYATWDFRKNRNYYDKTKYKFNGLSATIGVSNLLNAGKNSLPFIANISKPILPRQIFIGLKANLFSS